MGTSIIFFYFPIRKKGFNLTEISYKQISDILNEIRPNSDFENSSDFNEDGLLDSFDIVTLVAALDDAFKINIDGRDILPENFSSIEGIIELIKKNQD